MLPDEENVIGSEVRIEVAERGFEILGTVVVQDHGALAGDRDGVVGGARGSRRGQGEKELTTGGSHVVRLMQKVARCKRRRARRYNGRHAGIKLYAGAFLAMA